MPTRPRTTPLAMVTPRSIVVWPALLEVLARHATRCLEATTAFRAAQLLTGRAGDVYRPRRAALPLTATQHADVGKAASGAIDELTQDEAARRYARLLISEIKLYHEPEVMRRPARSRRRLEARRRNRARARAVTRSACPRTCAARRTTSTPSSCGRSRTATLRFSARRHEEDGARAVAAGARRGYPAAARAAAVDERLGTCAGRRAGARRSLRRTIHACRATCRSYGSRRPASAARRAPRRSRPSLKRRQLTGRAGVREGASDADAARGAAQAGWRVCAGTTPAVAELRLDRPAEALPPVPRGPGEASRSGTSSEAAAIGEAEASEALGDHRAAVEIYDRLSKLAVGGPGRRADAAGACGQGRRRPAKRRRRVRPRVLTTFRPATRRRSPAPSTDALPGRAAARVTDTQRYKLELGRAERLFGARRYTEARAAFRASGSRSPTGDDRELVESAARRVRLLPEALARRARRRAAVRRNGRTAGRGARTSTRCRCASSASRSSYLKLVRRIADEFPDAELGRRGAEQPGDLLHPRRRR